jgi:hypothetical protein
VTAGLQAINPAARRRSALRRLIPSRVYSPLNLVMEVFDFTNQKVRGYPIVMKNKTR